MSQALVQEFPAPGGEKISQLGYGAMGFHAFYGGKDPEQSYFDKVMNQLLDSLPNPVMVDTSDVYSRVPGRADNERALGQWFKNFPEARKRTFLATKFAFDAEFKLRCTKEDAIKCLSESIERLGVDVVDLYYVHRPDRSLGVENTFEGLKQLKDEGKVRYVGCSEFTLDELKRANAIVHVDAFQIEFSPWTPNVLYNGIADWCKENGTALVAYSPLARGALAGRFDNPDDIADDDFRKTNPRFQKETWETNMELLKDIKSIAERKGATPAQITLAWVMSKGNYIFPIPGTTNEGRLQENVGASKIRLTDQEEKEIDDIVKNFKVVGERYPESFAGALAF